VPTHRQSSAEGWRGAATYSASPSPALGNASPPTRAKIASSRIRTLRPWFLLPLTVSKRYLPWLFRLHRATPFAALRVDRAPGVVELAAWWFSFRP
jgi:hypothetical protein